MSRALRILLLASAVGTFALGVACTRRAEPDPIPPKADVLVNAPPEDVKALVEGNNQFAIELYKKLAEKPGNVIISPYSISSALAMTYGGARGQTAEEMAKVLHFTLPQERLHPAQAALGKAVRDPGKEGRSELHTANSLWAQRGFPIQSDFLRLNKIHYGAGVQEADFDANPEGECKAINQWVATQTRDKIPNLLHEGEIDPDTRLVLVNAVYFKGHWAYPFSKQGTTTETFWLSKTESTSVRMMFQVTQGGYSQGEGFKVVSLPYSASPLSMLVVVPDAVDGLDAIEKRLSGKKVEEWATKKDATYVYLSLPAFRLVERSELKSHLNQLGMRRAFGAADFSGISAQRLRIDKVVHEATLEVDEEGTVAAAATAVVMKQQIMFEAPREVVIRVDHPFLFLIVDQKHGGILFMGRVAHPKLN